MLADGMGHVAHQRRGNVRIFRDQYSGDIDVGARVALDNSGSVSEVERYRIWSAEMPSNV